MSYSFLEKYIPESPYNYWGKVVINSGWGPKDKVRDFADSIQSGTIKPTCNLVGLGQALNAAKLSEELNEDRLVSTVVEEKLYELRNLTRNDLLIFLKFLMETIYPVYNEIELSVQNFNTDLYQEDVDTGIRVSLINSKLYVQEVQSTFSFPDIPCKFSQLKIDPPEFYSSLTEFDLSLLAEE